MAGGAGAAGGAHWPGPGPHLHTRPQGHLPALSLPKAGPAHPPQGLPGAAAGPWPPAGPVAGAHPRRTPVGAPASAPHCRGPGCGAHAAAPSPGEGPGQEGWGCGRGWDSRPPALPGSPPLHLLPRAPPSLQGTVVFSTHVPALGRYAFLLHGFQPDHPTFTVEVLISGGRVWQGEWPWRAGGRPPRREAHQGSSDTAPLCGGRHRRGQIRPLLVLKRGAQGPAHTAAPASRPPARLCS